MLDFEGEPARSLAERRRKRSPLRDVAGMLRSFAYAASAAEVLAGRATCPPAGRSGRAQQFLDGYLETVDRSVVPPGSDAIEQLLAVFELEKAVYELRYELNNRPDWVGSRCGAFSACSSRICEARAGRTRTRRSARTPSNGGVIVRAFRRRPAAWSCARRPDSRSSSS